MKPLHYWISLKNSKIKNQKKEQHSGSRLSQGFLEIIIPKRYRSSHRRCFMKRLFFKILPYLQENTCAGVSFLIKLQAFSSATLLRDSKTGIPVHIAKFIKTLISRSICKRMLMTIGKIFEKYLKKSLFFNNFTKNEIRQIYTSKILLNL